MIHTMMKIIGFIIAIALVFFVAVTALGTYWPDIQAYRYKLEAERFKKEVEAEKLRIENLRKADTFGGKTPEETFDMFLEALGKNDAELSAKYYDVTVQSDALDSYKKELEEKGSLEMSLNYFTDVRKGEKKCVSEMSSCAFNFFDKVLNGDKSISFTEYLGGLWKITQPF